MSEQNPEEIRNGPPFQSPDHYVLPENQYSLLFHQVDPSIRPDSFERSSHPQPHHHHHHPPVSSNTHNTLYPQQQHPPFSSTNLQEPRVIPLENSISHHNHRPSPSSFHYYHEQQTNSPSHHHHRSPSPQNRSPIPSSPRSYNRSPTPEYDQKSLDAQHFSTNSFFSFFDPPAPNPPPASSSSSFCPTYLPPYNDSNPSLLSNVNNESSSSQTLDSTAHHDELGSTNSSVSPSVLPQHDTTCDDQTSTLSLPLTSIPSSSSPSPLPTRKSPSPSRSTIENSTNEIVGPIRSEGSPSVEEVPRNVNTPISDSNHESESMNTENSEVSLISETQNSASISLSPHPHSTTAPPSTSKPPKMSMAFKIWAGEKGIDLLTLPPDEIRTLQNEKRKEGRLERSQSETAKQKRREYRKEYRSRPHVREQRKQYMQQYHQREYVKEKQKEYLRDYLTKDENRKKHRARNLETSRKRRVKDPVQAKKKAYQFEYVRRPDVMERNRNYMRVYYQKKKKENTSEKGSEEEEVEVVICSPGQQSPREEEGGHGCSQIVDINLCEGDEGVKPPSAEELVSGGSLHGNDLICHDCLGPTSCLHCFGSHLILDDASTPLGGGGQTVPTDFLVDDCRNDEIR